MQAIEFFTTDVMTQSVGRIMGEYIAMMIDLKENDAFLIDVTQLTSLPMPLSRGGALKLEIVPHDRVAAIPKHVQSRTDFVHKVNILSKTIALSFQVLMQSSLTHEAAESYESDPFLIKFDADTYTYLPTYVHPDKFELDAARKYRQEILDIRDTLVDEDKWDNEPESSKVYMNLEYNKYDSVVKRIEYNLDQINESERIKNEDFEMCLRIGITYVPDV
jgi:hypothetical protein